MNECIPFYRPGHDLTATADDDIIGKRFVKLVQADISPGLSDVADGSNYVVGLKTGTVVLGVSKYDALAGAKVGVIVAGSIVPVTAAAALTGGTFVGPDADGKAVGGGAKNGLLMADCEADEDAQVLLLPPV